MPDQYEEDFIGRHRADNHEDVIDRVAAMAARVFPNRDYDWRLGYFSPLAVKNPGIFTLVTFPTVRLTMNGWVETFQDLAYISVLPLATAIGEEHRAGRFDQYELRPEHLLESFEEADPTKPLYLYVQAIAINQKNSLLSTVRNLYLLLRNRPIIGDKRVKLPNPLERAFWNHLKRIGLTSDYKDVVLYAEIFSEDGLRLVQTSGWTNTGFRSKEGNHEIWEWHSKYGVGRFRRFYNAYIK